MAIEYKREIEVSEPDKITLTLYVKENNKHRKYWTVGYCRIYKATVTADSIESLNQQIDAAWNQFKDLQDKLEAEAKEKNDVLEKQYREEDRIEAEREDKLHEKYNKRQDYKDKCRKEALEAWNALPFYIKWNKEVSIFIRNYIDTKMDAYDKKNEETDHAYDQCVKPSLQGKPVTRG